MRHTSLSSPTDTTTGAPLPRTALVLALAMALSACSTVENWLSGEKVDYRNQSEKTKPLEVPPDLTQLARDGRYQTQASGTVSASGLNSAVPAATPPSQAARPASVATVAPNALGDLRIAREGNQRWLQTPLSPEVLWPQLRAALEGAGYKIVEDNPRVGVMETDWRENRAKIADDVIRRTIGRVFDGLYSSSERDRFRLRVERNGNVTEVYASHRGVEEVYTDAQRSSTRWVPRANDPQLEAELLTRLLVALGGKDEVTKPGATAVAAAPSASTGAATSSKDAVGSAALNTPARARLLTGQPGAALQVDETFDRAWRRVGLTLDRSGFTVEDRDRGAGLYFVRYVDPKIAAQDEPGFFAKLFGKEQDPSKVANRYRIKIVSAGTQSTVSILNGQGAPDSSPIAQNIAARLVGDLR